MPQPLYVIPDIHGQKARLDRALEQVRADGGDAARIVFLGDLVDRGPDSRGVIDTLLEGIAQGYDWTVLRGNHDQMFLDFLDGSGRANGWLTGNLGAAETLVSYGADTLSAAAAVQVPAAHRDFLASLPLYAETDDLILVHAGLRPGVPLRDQSGEDLLWIREPFLSDRNDHGRLVVHGHTPVRWPEHHGNRVALDGGAGFGRTLHVAVFERRDCWLLTHGEREPLRPAR